MFDPRTPLPKWVIVLGILMFIAAFYVLYTFPGWES